MGLLGSLFSSSNSSKATNTTNNYDQRVVADGGGIGLSGNGSTFNINQLDGGVVNRAIDSLDSNFKLVQDGAGEGFAALLGLTERLFDKSSEQQSSLSSLVNKSVLDAYSQASGDAKGTIDNRTIIALAVAAAVVVGLIYMRK